MALRKIPKVCKNVGGKGEMRANDDCIGSTIASVVELKSPNNPESKKPDPKEIEKLNAKSAI